FTADPQSAEADFDANVADFPASPALGTTFQFDDGGGVTRSYMCIKDNVLLDRAFQLKPNTALRLQLQTRDVLAHELTHEGNVFQLEIDVLTNDTDTTAFANTDLAGSMTAKTGIRTAEELRDFVEEMIARHVAWIVVHEDDGDPDAAKNLDPEALAAAA